jgi:hypothetical protein
VIRYGRRAVPAASIIITPQSPLSTSEKSAGQRSSCSSSSGYGSGLEPLARDHSSEGGLYFGSSHDAQEAAFRFQQPAKVGPVSRLPLRIRSCMKCTSTAISSRSPRAGTDCPSCTVKRSKASYRESVLPDECDPGLAPLVKKTIDRNDNHRFQSGIRSQEPVAATTTLR